MAAVPLLILFDSESPDQSLNNQAWAAAFVLMIFVLVFSPHRALHTLPPRAEAASAVGAVHQIGAWPLTAESAHVRDGPGDAGRAGPPGVNPLKGVSQK